MVEGSQRGEETAAYASIVFLEKIAEVQIRYVDG